MLPLLARIAAAAKSAVKSVTAPKVTPRTVAVSRVRVKPTVPLKPNKLINPPRRVPATRVPFSPAVPNRGVGTRPRIPVHSGNATPVDRTHADTYHKPSGNTPSPTNNPVPPNPQGAGMAERAALLGSVGLQAFSALSPYIPSIVYQGRVEARGFKNTPLRNVLHYCLAVSFGLVKQTRIGATKFHVECYPTENRVVVVYENSTMALFEWANIGVASFLETINGVNNLVKRVGARVLGNPIGWVSGVKQMVGENPKEAANFLLKHVGDVNRRIGPGGVWDMGMSDIHAGTPPITVTVPGIEPYTTMYNESAPNKKPMLTRKMAANPEVPEIPGKHWPTHFDLRSLVAQSLYEPGVLPPPPDTVVSLGERDLP